MTTGFNKIFGGDAVRPSDNTYDAIDLTANVTLSWPIEAVSGEIVVCDFMDITPEIPGGWDIVMPDARGGSLGVAAVFSNLSGLYTFDVKDNAGNLIVTPDVGTVWLLYLVDNSTQAGVWRAFQYGAQAGSVNVPAIAGSGLVAIGTSLNQSMPVSSKNSNYTAVDGDRATVILWTGGAGTLILPDPGTVGSNWFINVRNIGTGDLTVDPAVGNIDSGATKTFTAGVSSAIIFTDGANYYTIGYGTSGAVGGFDYTTIDVSGTGDYTISGAQLNRISYKLTGALTGNRNFVVPTTVQQYWVNNATTSTGGPWTLTVKTAAGTGQTVSQPGQSIVYCDGTNVVPAISGLALPLAIGSGGTGATTQGGARTNLGSTATGDALFTAASAAAARTTLGATTVGNNIFTAASASAALTALAGGTLTGALSVSGLFSAGTVAVTSTTAPANGIYQKAANQLGLVSGSVLAAYFDGTQNLILTHPLAIGQGGTGATTVNAALAALGLVGMDTAATANTLLERDASGFAFAQRFFATSYLNQASALENPTIGATGGVFVENSAHDGYLRKISLVNLALQLNPNALATYGRFTNNSSGTAAKLANCTVTRVSTGLYTVTFTTAQTDANYTVVFGTQQIAGNPGITAMIAQGTTPTTASFQIEVVNGTSRIELGGIVSFAVLD